MGSDEIPKVPGLNLFNLPDDQLKFLVCQLTAFLLGFPFRGVFSAQKVSPWLRHIIQVCVGVTLAVYCFGSGTIHIFAQSALCYALMLALPGRWKGIGVFVTAMAYLCVTHILRQYHDYGGYTLDVTGPLMIVTQRLSSLAFSLQDGGAPDQAKLSPHNRQYAISKVPHPLHFLSYIFCFHSLMCGPFCFYKDYMAFIDGSCFKTKEHSNGSVHPVQESRATPSPIMPMLSALCQTLVCGVVLAVWVPLWPPSLLEESEFFEASFFSKFFSIMMVTTLTRFKYYFAWKLGETVNLSCGLGFNGYDAQGKAQWDLVSLVDIYGVECSLNLKALLDSWNRTTNSWLRYTVYSRFRHSPTAAVFLVSALWHGFYPGYYLTFLTAALITHASRIGRRCLRARCCGSPGATGLYHAVTFAMTRCIIAYLSFPFVLLDFGTSLAVYSSIYFWMHIGCVLVISLLPVVLPPLREKPQEIEPSAKKTK